MNECVARAGFVEPFSEEHLKINLQSKPVDRDSELIRLESGSVCVKVDPDNIISENLQLSVNLNSEPVHTESEPKNLEPINLDSGPLIIESEQVNPESIPENIESNLVHKELETVIVEVKPVDVNLEPVIQDSETVGSKPNNINLEQKLQHVQNRPVHFVLDAREILHDETVGVSIVKPETPKQNGPGNNLISFRPKKRVHPLYFGPAVPHKALYKPEPYDRKSGQKASATCEDGFFCCLGRIFAKSLRLTFRGDKRRREIDFCLCETVRVTFPALTSFCFEE